MKDNKKMVVAVIVVIALIVATAGATYSLWTWSSNTNTNVDFSLNGLDAYIIYNKGTDILQGTLDPTSTYQESAINSEITLYQNGPKQLYGHIYLDVSEIGTNMQSEPAVKWVITSNNAVLGSGNFVGSTNGSSIPLATNIQLSSTEQKFQIYLWLDESMDINDAIEGEPLTVVIKAEATEVTI